MNNNQPVIEFSNVAFSFSNRKTLFRDLSLVIDPGKFYLNNFLLNDVNLETNAQTLSVGQLQRLCFIRGLLLDPKVLLLDEPASALDEESSRIVEETAERLCVQSGLTVLMVSHRKFNPRRAASIFLQVKNGRVEEIK